MLYIPRFAKEIGLDSISFQKLRVEKFSPLQEIVDATPGYYYERVGTAVYSDRYGRKELKRIRNRIRSAFYDAPRLLRIAKKARRIGLIDGRDATTILLRLPLLAYRLACHTARKGRYKRKVKRAHPVTTPEPNVTRELAAENG